MLTMDEDGDRGAVIIFGLRYDEQRGLREWREGLGTAWSAMEALEVLRVRT